MAVMTVAQGDSTRAAFADIASRSNGEWLLISSRRGAASDTAASLRELRPDVQSLCIEGPPAPDNLLALLKDVRQPSIVFGLGGGSVIDATKVAAMASAHGGGVAWFQQWLVEGGAVKPPHRLPRIVAIPTLVGSGSEMTQFATIWLRGRKVSLEHALLKPTHVIRDAKNVLSAPPDAIVLAAQDALSHALEAIWNKNADTDSDAFASAALVEMTKVFPSLRGNVYELGLERLFAIAAEAGRAIAISRTALAHSISYAFTCEHTIPHALASSFALSEVAQFCLEHNADRLVPAARAFGCCSRDVPQAIAALQEATGFSAIARRYLWSGIVEATTLPMIDASRSRNSIRLASEDDARCISRRAVERAWSAA